MPKVEELTRIKAMLKEEREAKNKKNMPWIIGFSVLFGGLLIGVLISENTPDSRKARSETAQREDRRKLVEAETEKSYKLFKEAEELQKMRPLNPVEERLVKDYARQAAEQKYPKPSSVSGISNESKSPETWQEKVIAIKNEMLRLEPPALCEYGDRERLRGIDAPDKILSTAKVMLETSISVTKLEKKKWLPGGKTDPGWNKLEARMYPNPKDRKAYREKIVKECEESISQKEQVLARVIALTNTAH